MSDFIPKITYAQALAKGFNESTLDELRYYYTERKGVTPPPKMNGPTLAKNLRQDAGITNEFSGAKVGQFKPGQEPIFPDYNVSPNGKWGGRRHRIKVGRPSDATKNENILSLSWNGSASYHIRYGEVQAVPEPVYMRLKVLQRPVPVARRTTLDDGSVEITTDLRSEDRYQISYIGVDPDTADKAGSLTEWYQLKGPNWMRERTWRDCQLIAQRLEMKWQDDDKRPLPEDDIKPRLIEFFFGHADAQEAA